MTGVAGGEGCLARGGDTGDLHVADLYRAHHAAIFGVCRRYLRDDAEAEDATQETFLAAHKSLSE